MEVLEKNNEDVFFDSCVQGSTTGAAEGSHNSSVPEATLQRHLFQSYYVEARPVFDPSQAVNVAIQFAINHIVDFDEDTHVVTVVGFLTLTWKDEQLVWDPSKYSDIRSFPRATADIWTPDVMLQNPIGPSILLRKTKTVVMSDGTVTLVEPRRYQVHCDAPSPDEASCVLVFGPWTGNTAVIAMSAPVERADASFYKQHRTWELSKTKATKHSTVYACCPESYDSVRFSLSLKRRRDLNADRDSSKDSGAAAARVSLAAVAAVVVAAWARL
ncbi:hypothetical protein LSAT2_022723 [Lamellibrachia satsuma]|nr:hypothetical protein LSAT2_022723 [Lamellibrachia satsuma]